MPPTRSKKQSTLPITPPPSTRKPSGRARATPPSESSSSSSSLSDSSDSDQTSRIPKGLTIGHDNWADMNPRGLARLSFMQDAEGYREYYTTEVDPNATDDDIISLMQVDWEKNFDSIKLSAAHPKADDESVRYTVIPKTPWGELTIRWWADHLRGNCFDLVDIARLKVRAVPKDLQFHLWASYGSSTELESLEEGHRLANLGGAVVKYTPNADGVVEERFAVPKRSRLGLHKRGTKELIALIIGPGADEDFDKDFGVPIYLPTTPV